MVWEERSTSNKEQLMKEYSATIYWMASEEDSRVMVLGLTVSGNKEM